MTVNAFRLSGDALHLSALVFLVVGVVRYRSSKSLSLRSQELFLLCYVLRYLDLWDGPHRRVGRGNPGWLVWYNFAAKLVFIATAFATCALVRAMGRRWEWDSTKDRAWWYLLVVPTGIAGALLAESSSARERCWTASVFIESVAILPQIAMIPSSKGLTGPVLCFLASMGTYKMLYDDECGGVCLS